jgi:hypothetical protein
LSAWTAARRSWSGSSTGPPPLPPEATAAAPSPPSAPPRAFALRRREVLFFVLALALTAGAVAWQQERQRDPHVAYGRFHLPGFDAYVYVAMAERPAVFTVAPWGYRIVVPAVVHALGYRNVVRGFRLLSFAGLVAAGGLLFLFLRRRGHAHWAALLGVALFGLTPPMARVVETPFFLEPVGIVLMLALLLAVESGAGWGTVALVATAMTLAKDGVIVLSLAPAILLARWRADRYGALFAALAAAVPAALLTPILRWWWTPHIPAISAPWDLELVRAGWLTLRDVWAPTVVGALAGGLLPLAALGALRAKGREHLRRYGISLALLMAMAFLAWLKVPSREPVPLFGDNFERLLIYSVPLLLPLALAALDRRRPNLGPAPPLRPPRRQWPAALATVAAIALPFALVDRYARVDLQGSRDGPLVLAVCRESWKTATRIAAGEAVTFDPESRRFAWGESDPGQLARMRWFLRGGWGARAHYGTNEIVMHEPAATLLLPLLAPADVEVRLRVMSPTPLALALDVNGSALGSWLADAAAAEQVFRVPARVLFRGDNLVTLSSPDGRVSARLREISFRRLPAS